VFHVLHRRLTPRHPPYALSSFHPRDAEKLILHYFIIAMWLVKCWPGARRPRALGLVAQPCPASPSSLRSPGPRPTA
jgi:hypothetical protein